MALALAGTASATCDNPVTGKDGEKPHHRVHWSTRSELLSAGFDVLRADKVDGEFVKLNDKPIPSGGNSARPRDYEYKDFAIDPCKTYFYYVEAFSQNGYRIKLTEPQQAGPGAKKAADAKAEKTDKPKADKAEAAAKSQ